MEGKGGHWNSVQIWKSNNPSWCCIYQPLSLTWTQCQGRKQKNQSHGIYLVNILEIKNTAHLDFQWRDRSPWNHSFESQWHQWNSQQSASLLLSLAQSARWKHNNICITAVINVIYNCLENVVKSNHIAMAAYYNAFKIQFQWKTWIWHIGHHH